MAYLDGSGLAYYHSKVAALIKNTADDIQGEVDDLKNAINEIVPELMDKGEPINFTDQMIEPGQLKEDRTYTTNSAWRRLKTLRALESGSICIEFQVDGCSIRVFSWKDTGSNTYQLVSDSGWTTRPVIIHGETGLDYGFTIHNDANLQTFNTDTVLANLKVYKMHDLAELKVSVDDTLSNAGVPADAKATGDKISGIKSALNFTASELANKNSSHTIPATGFTSGYWKVDRTATGGSQFRRTTSILSLENSGDRYIHLPLDGYMIYVLAWEENNGTYKRVTDSGWTTDPVLVHGGENVTYTISVKTIQDIVMDEQTKYTISENLQIYDLFDLAAIKNSAERVDTTLSLAGVPADAQAVGNAINNLDVDTDDTLSLEGKAADAKATGDEINGVKGAINEIVPELVDKSKPFNIPSGAVERYLLNDDRSVSQRPAYRHIKPRTVNNGDICIEFTAPGCTMIVYSWKQTGEDTYQLILNSGWTNRPVVVHGGTGVSVGMSFHDDTDSDILNDVVTSNLSIHYLYDLAEIKTSAEQEVSVDTTLSLAGVPADAQATGDAVESLESTIYELTTKKVVNSNVWNKGSLNYQGGGNSSSVKKLRSNRFFEDEDILAFSVADGFEYAVFAYYKEGRRPDDVASDYVGVWGTSSSYIKTSSFAWLKTDFKIVNPDYRYKILLRYENDTVDEIADEDIDEISHKLYVIVPRSAQAEINTDTTLTEEGVPADAKATGDAINAVGGVKSYIDPDVADIAINTVCTTGKSYGTGTRYKDWNTIKLYPVNPDDLSLSFYINARCYLHEYSDNVSLSDDLIKSNVITTKSIIKLDENTRYITISYYKTNIPSDTFLMVPINNDAAYVFGDLLNNAYMKPKNAAIANIIASANQFLNIEYTTKAPMPVTNTAGYVLGETHLKGLPYSSTRSVCKYIGQHVSLYTFLTAIHNPKSVLYTRRIKYGHLGKTYYGTTCFTFPSYAYGSRLGFFDNMATRRLNSSGEFERKSPYEVEVGDIMFTSKNSTGGSHESVVMDLHRDECGRIKFITLGESNYPFCRKTTFPFEVDSYGRIRGSMNEGVNWYYPFRMVKRIDPRTNQPDYGYYDKLDFVKGFDDEIPVEPVYPDIMPEYGDKAAIEAGQDVLINVIDGTGYDYIEVYKDDVAVYSQSEGNALPVEDFTMPSIAYGLYKFKLVGASKESESSLVAVDVNGTFNQSTGDITFSSANATPTFVASYGDWDSAGGTNHSSVGVQLRVLRFTSAQYTSGSANVSEILDSTHNQVQVGFLAYGYNDEPYGVAMWRSKDLQNDPDHPDKKEWETLTGEWWNNTSGMDGEDQDMSDVGE